MARTKKLTDPIYSPTNPTSEAAIRSQIDDSIQEVYDQSAKATDTVNLTGNQTIADVKTFSSSPIVPTPTTNFQASTKEYVDTKDATSVKTTGAQNIAGVKTFTDSPVVPYPTGQAQASNKQYVDDTVAGVVVGVIPDGSITDLKLSNVAGQVKDRVSTLESGIATKAEQSDVDLKAPINSPTFTGTPLAPTATTGTNTTQLATTEFVQTEIAPKFEQSNYGNISTRAASWTLVLSDGNDVITVSVAAVITIPANATVAFPIGTAITFIRTGTGAVTFVPSGGVTLLSKDTKRAIDGQYASATLVKTATDTWHLFGALA